MSFAEEGDRVQDRVLGLTEHAVLIATRPQTTDYTIMLADGSTTSIKANGASDRLTKMREAGIDPDKDRWACRHADPSTGLSQICGNDDEARSLIEQHLRKR